MQPAIKKILVIVVVIAVVLWCLSLFGIFDMANGGPRIGHPHR